MEIPSPFLLVQLVFATINLKSTNISLIIFKSTTLIIPINNLTILINIFINFVLFFRTIFCYISNIKIRTFVRALKLRYITAGFLLYNISVHATYS
jgi:hypothetical protein